MTQIAPLTIDTADAATAATLKAVKAKLGMVPNLFATLAHAPAALNGYLGLSETLGTGRLNASQREIVALAAGQANRCQYCLSAHTLIGKGAGLSAEAIAAARTGQAANALDDAIAGFARALVEQRGVVSADAMANYRRAGLYYFLFLFFFSYFSLFSLSFFSYLFSFSSFFFPFFS
ncbi:carboxymuconolactone decarboxylase family protein, partial [Pseudomonas fluorescens]|uniref:carboxymuconolactone decarboxylase family protein n=1 Tax=Pseudomonas fluorescens TaxID=294 RepID=UPI0021593499